MIPKYKIDVWEKRARKKYSDTNEVYRHLPKGMLANLYHKMEHRNVEKGYGSLPFSSYDFREWAYSEEKFLYIFDIWSKSGYKKEFKPSVDRTNPFIGYRFENMTWMFWEDNKIKSHGEVGAKKQKAIIMLRDGKRVGSFKSIKDAQFFLGMKSNGNISECLSGRRNNVFGYQFIYETPELLEADHDRA